MTEREPSSEVFDAIADAWAHLDDGDVDGAREALARAEAVDAGASEVLTFRGVLAAHDGDDDAALALFERAAAADPENARPSLHAAEVWLYSRDEPARAIELADRALDVADDEDDLIDAVMVKAEACVAVGDRDDEARACLAELDGCDIDDPAVWCRAGDLHLTLGELEAAENAYQEALELDDFADAHYGLGLLADARGDRDAMIAAWLEARRADLAEPPPPWHMSAEDFEEVAEAAMAELPREIIDRLANVPILIDDAPSEALVAEGVDPRLLGLFSGVALPYKTTEGQVPALDTVHLFQRNLERAAHSREHLAEEIRITVLHETAHFFGLDDDDLHRLGLG